MLTRAGERASNSLRVQFPIFAEGFWMSRFYLLLTLVFSAVLAVAQTNATRNPAPGPATSTQLPNSGAKATASTGASSSASSKTNEDYDPLLDVPPLPKGKVTLIGGTVTGIDRVRDKLNVRAFGGKKMSVAFDERSHIYRDGAETTQLGIRKGDRVYLDTMLDGARVFAKNIRVETRTGGADARGQVLSYNPSRGALTLRDELSSRPVEFRIAQNVVVKRGDQPGSLSELTPGSLVAVKFATDGVDRATIREVSIYATPGANFTFSGPVTYLDLRLNKLAIANRTDNKTYEIDFDPATLGPERGNLQIGRDVTVLATFEPRGYRADKITVNSNQ
jgi:hypothetical protein